MKLGEAIYKSQQSAKPGDAPKDNKQEGKKDDNVVDADFEEVKDENKEKGVSFHNYLSIINYGKKRLLRSLRH